MNFSLKNYKKPTPVGIRRLVDAVNGAFAVSGLAAVVAGYPHGAIVVALIAFILKALSNFYANDVKSESVDSLSVNKSNG